MQPTRPTEPDRALVHVRDHFLRNHQQQLKALAEQWIKSNVPDADVSRETTGLDLRLLLNELPVEAHQHHLDPQWGELLQHSMRHFVAQITEVFSDWFNQAKPDQRTLFYLVLQEVRDHVRACESALSKLQFFVSCQRRVWLSSVS